MLVARERGFHVDSLDRRYVTEDAEAVVCAVAELPVADRESLSVDIGGDVMLLFHHGRYVGWILRALIRHLVTMPEDELTGTDSLAMRAPLHTYLTLVVEPNIAKMADEDLQMREALQQLLAWVRSRDGAQARALRRAA